MEDERIDRLFDDEYELFFVPPKTLLRDPNAEGMSTNERFCLLLSGTASEESTVLMHNIKAGCHMVMTARYDINCWDDETKQVYDPIKGRTFRPWWNDELNFVKAECWSCQCRFVEALKIYLELKNGDTPAT